MLFRSEQPAGHEACREPTALPDGTGMGRLTTTRERAHGGLVGGVAGRSQARLCPSEPRKTIRANGVSPAAGRQTSRREGEDTPDAPRAFADPFASSSRNGHRLGAARLAGARGTASGVVGRERAAEAFQGVGQRAAVDDGVFVEIPEVEGGGGTEIGRAHV